MGFQSGYNRVSAYLLVRRFGSQFIDQTLIDARRDVIVRNVTLRGQYERGELRVANSDQAIHVAEKIAR